MMALGKVKFFTVFFFGTGELPSQTWVLGSIEITGCRLSESLLLKRLRTNFFKQKAMILGNVNYPT